MTVFRDGSRLGQMIYLWRVIQRLTMAELARDLGVSVATVMWLERGKPPSRTIWYRLEPWLVEESGRPPAPPLELPTRKKGKRGLASMLPEHVREIASKGGVEAHRQGRAHEWTREEARRFGRKGGSARRRKKPR